MDNNSRQPTDKKLSEQFVDFIDLTDADLEGVEIMTFTGISGAEGPHGHGCGCGHHHGCGCGHHHGCEGCGGCGGCDWGYIYEGYAACGCIGEGCGCALISEVCATC